MNCPNMTQLTPKAHKKWNNYQPFRNPLCVPIPSHRSVFPKDNKYYNFWVHFAYFLSKLSHTELTLLLCLWDIYIIECGCLLAWALDIRYSVFPARYFWVLFPGTSVIVRFLFFFYFNSTDIYHKYKYLMYGILYSICAKYKNGTVHSWTISMSIARRHGQKILPKSFVAENIRKMKNREMTHNPK